jgi:hypothetical protein
MEAPVVIAVGVFRQFSCLAMDREQLSRSNEAGCAPRGADNGSIKDGEADEEQSAGWRLDSLGVCVPDRCDSMGYSSSSRFISNAFASEQRCEAD